MKKYIIFTVLLLLTVGFVLADGTDVMENYIAGTGAGANLAIIAGATRGTNNTFVGVSSGYATTTGRSNVGFGYGALRGVTTGIGNIGIGMLAGQDLTTENYYMHIGTGYYPTYGIFGILSSGYIGINKAAPVVELDVIGALSVSGTFLLDDKLTVTDSLSVRMSPTSDTTDSAWVVTVPSTGFPKMAFLAEGNDEWHITTNTSDQLLIVGASGGVVIGTADTDDALLLLHGDAATAGATARLYNAANEDGTGYDNYVFEATGTTLALGGDADTDVFTFNYDGSFLARKQLTIGDDTLNLDGVITGIDAGGGTSTITWDETDQVIFAGAVGGYSFDETITLSHTTSAAAYTSDIAVTWANTQDMASHGSNGIYSISKPNFDVNNAYALRGRMDMRAGDAAETDVNQLHAVDALVNLHETKDYDVVDNISVFGGAIHGGTSGDVLTTSGDGTLNIFYGVWGQTANQEYTVENNLMLLITHAATNVDYGIQIQNSADMDAGIYLNNHTSNSPATMDVGIEMVSAASKMVYGIDMSAADFTTADIRLDDGNTIDDTAGGVVINDLDNTPIGVTTPNIGNFTTLNADSTTIITHGTPWDLTDGEYTGTTVSGLAHENIDFGEVCFMNSDGEYALAQGDAAGKPGLVMGLEGTISADAYGLFLQVGYVCETSWSTVQTKGAWVYVDDDTAGLATTTIPPDTGDQVQKIGYCIQTDIMFFNPDYTVVEVP